MARNEITWYEILATLCIIFLVVDVGKWLYVAFVISTNPALWTIVGLDRWVPAIWIVDPPIVILAELSVLIACFVVIIAVFIKRIVRS